LITLLKVYSIIDNYNILKDLSNYFLWHCFFFFVVPFYRQAWSFKATCVVSLVSAEEEDVEVLAVACVYNFVLLTSFHFKICCTFTPVHFSVWTCLGIKGHTGQQPYKENRFKGLFHNQMHKSEHGINAELALKSFKLCDVVANHISPPAKSKLYKVVIYCIG
jgi:hypothetical protein